MPSWCFEGSQLPSRSSDDDDQPAYMDDMHKLRCATGKVVLGWNRCEHLIGDQWLEPGFLEKQYQKHVNVVKSRVPPEQLLVFNVKEGWEPLCRFLELAVPDAPFPHVGDTAMLERSRVIFQICVVIWIPMLFLIACALYNMIGVTRKIKVL